MSDFIMNLFQGPNASPLPGDDRTGIQAPDPQSEAFLRQLFSKRAAGVVDRPRSDNPNLDSVFSTNARIATIENEIAELQTDILRTTLQDPSVMAAERQLQVVLQARQFLKDPNDSQYLEQVRTQRKAAKDARNFAVEKAQQVLAVRGLDLSKELNKEKATLKSLQALVTSTRGKGDTDDTIFNRVLALSLPEESRSADRKDVPTKAVAAVRAIVQRGERPFAIYDGEVADPAAARANRNYIINTSFPEENRVSAQRRSNELFGEMAKIKEQITGGGRGAALTQDQIDVKFQSRMLGFGAEDFTRQLLTDPALFIPTRQADTEDFRIQKLIVDAVRNVPRSEEEAAQLNGEITPQLSQTFQERMVAGIMDTAERMDLSKPKILSVWKEMVESGMLRYNQDNGPFGVRVNLASFDLASQAIESAIQVDVVRNTVRTQQLQHMNRIKEALAAEQAVNR